MPARPRRASPPRAAHGSRSPATCRPSPRCPPASAARRRPRTSPRARRDAGGRASRHRRSGPRRPGRSSGGAAPRGAAGARPSRPGALAGAARSRRGRPSASRRPRAPRPSPSGARPGARSASSPKLWPGPRTSMSTLSPSGVEHARAEAPADDEVQRVGRVVAVEDDLAARERPRRAIESSCRTSSGGRSASSGHSMLDSLCHGGDIRNVAARERHGRARLLGSGHEDRTREEHTMKRIATIGASSPLSPSPRRSPPPGTSRHRSSRRSRRRSSASRPPRRSARQAAVSVQRHLVQIAQARALRHALRAQIR